MSAELKTLLLCSSCWFINYVGHVGTHGVKHGQATCPRAAFQSHLNGVMRQCVGLPGASPGEVTIHTPLLRAAFLGLLAMML